MYINSNNRQYVTLDLRSFELKPRDIDLEEDWINVELEICDEHANWHITDPSLTSAEVISLIHWLQDLAANKQVKDHLYFIEPNLSFHLIRRRQNRALIRIDYMAELKPSWFSESSTYSQTYSFDYDSLETIAHSLTKELESLYAVSGCEYKLAS